MNERIFELAEQAGFFGCMDEGAGLVFRKFAELIVRECVGLVNDQLQHNNPNDSLLALKIKEHFGVE